VTKILIIYTGGTIGMVEAEDQKTLVPFDFEHVMTQVPELSKIDAELDSVSFDAPIDSSDMQPSHWREMAQIIAAHYDSHDGFVILHGSDTLAYTASALSYMLSGLKKPVVLTGSQLPIGMIRTDARENFITAVEVAAMNHNGEPIIQEVAVYFEYKLYRGNRIKKYSTEAFEAFISPNYPVLGEAGVNLKFNRSDLFRTTFDAFTVNDQLDERVVVLTLFPGISEQLVMSVLTNSEARAIVLMTFGAGNAPRQEWLIKTLKQASDSGKIVVNVSQCPKGSVAQGKYATSKGLLNAGVISGGDMTLEATIIKLMFVLGQNGDLEWSKKMIQTDLRGELTV